MRPNPAGPAIPGPRTRQLLVSVVQRAGTRELAEWPPGRRRQIPMRPEPAQSRSLGPASPMRQREAVPGPMARHNQAHIGPATLLGGHKRLQIDTDLGPRPFLKFGLGHPAEQSSPWQDIPSRAWAGPGRPEATVIDRTIPSAPLPDAGRRRCAPVPAKNGGRDASPSSKNIPTFTEPTPTPGWSNISGPGNTLRCSRPPAISFKKLPDDSGATDALQGGSSALARGTQTRRRLS